MNNHNFLVRFRQYQKERFLIVQNAFLVTVFTFAAVIFSVFARGGEGFVRPALFLNGTLIGHTTTLPEGVKLIPVFGHSSPA